MTHASKTLVWIFVVLFVGGLLAGCGRIQQNPAQANQNGVSVQMALVPEQPAVGQATLVFTVLDSQGQPINDASLEVEGNMTHAGMKPVLAQRAGGQNGRYTVPFEWTMGGDWVVTVKVNLADGRTVTRQFPVTVQ